MGETDGEILIPIVRIGNSSGAVNVEIGITPTGNAAQNQVATPNVDYRYTGPTTVTIPAGEDGVLVPVEIIDDGFSEPTQSFAISLINVNSGDLSAPRTARVDILGDENPVTDPSVPPLTSDFDVSTQTVVSGLTRPLAFEFSPLDPSLIYVAEKGGKIEVYDVDTGSFQSTFIDLSSVVNNVQDRGLLDIALHPDFGAQNPYLYVFYVVDPPDTAGKTGKAYPAVSGDINIL